MSIPKIKYIRAYRRENDGPLIPDSVIYTKGYGYSNKFGDQMDCTDEKRKLTGWSFEHGIVFNCDNGYEYILDDYIVQLINNEMKGE